MKNKELEFKTLHSNKYRIYFFAGIVCVVVLLIVFIVGRSHARYRVTQSIPLVNGTINYTPYDFKMVAMYQRNQNGEYTEIEVMPSSGYVINEEMSYCTLDGTNRDENAILKTINGNHTIANLSKGSKCYLYFDKKRVTNVQELIASKNLAIRTDFSTTVTEDTTGTIYYAGTSKGRTYYFAGNPTDNWVYFGGFYWCIIRINEDGSIRMIYHGTAANTIGSNTQIQISKFNDSYDNNMYVGFKYTSGQVHGTGTNSTILVALNNWYTSSQLSNYANNLDENAGFCGDREPSTSSLTSNGSGGTGTTTTYYGAYIRLIANKMPTFECSDADLYTTSGSSQGNKSLTNPIGLISADEVAYAGGAYGANNTSYYLYTNQSYWTISPDRFSGVVSMFFVDTKGYLSPDDAIYGIWGIRPVINLKADVIFSSGDGTSSNPYVVN